MSHFYDIPVADPAQLSSLMAELGSRSYGRLISYLVEDGPRAIAGIEHAMAHGMASAIVGPAHRLKGDAAQLGALRLAALAEFIEAEARECVEERRTPDALQGEVAMLRACFTQSVAILNSPIGMATVEQSDARSDARMSEKPAPLPGPASAHTASRPSFGRRAIR